MGFVIRSGAAAAVAAVTVAMTTATPTQRPSPAASSVGSSSLVNLTASSRMLYLAADQIDDQFIEFRNTARTDFHTFANELGYLGKQLYIAVNFGETIAASAVFNGTDMLRGEGVLKNLSEMTDDAFLAGLWIVVDNLYLALPGLPPIVILPDRGPVDSPPEWRRPLPPQPGRPLVVPFPDGPEASDALTDDDSMPEKYSGTADVAAAATPETDDSAVQPPADDVSAVAEGADEQEDLQEEQAVDSEAEESEGREQPAGTTLQDSGSDDEGATDVRRRVTRPGRA